MSEEDRFVNLESLILSAIARMDDLSQRHENTNAMMQQMRMQMWSQSTGAQNNSNMIPGFGQEQRDNLVQPQLDTGDNRAGYESPSPGPPNLIPIPTGDAPAPTGIGGNSSRNTFLVAQTGAQPTGAATHGIAQLASAMVIHTQEKVSPAEQVQYLTWPGLRQVFEAQTNHNTRSDQVRPKVQFVSPRALKLLVANEHRHMRNLDMTEASIMKSPDEAFVRIFAAYVRVHQMDTAYKFGDTFLKAIPKLVPMGADVGRPLAVQDYDLYFHAPVNKHVETVEKTFELIDLGATLEETRHWCKDHGYGKGDDFGRVRMCVWSLRPYNKHFENQIGMGVLKNMKGPEDWYLEMRKINNRLAKIAGDLRAAQAGITPAVRLEDIAKKVDESRSNPLGPRAVLTKDGPRDIRLPYTPFLRNSRQQGATGRTAVLGYEEDPLNDE